MHLPHWLLIRNWDVQVDLTRCVRCGECSRKYFAPVTRKRLSFGKACWMRLRNYSPGEIIHIGGDECPRDAWKKCKKCQTRMKQEKMKEEGELQDYTVHRIEAYLKGEGKRVIGWDEILEGDVSKTAIVMSWRGKTGGIKGGEERKRGGDGAE